MGPVDKLGPVDLTRVVSRIEEIRANARAKIFEAANRLPVNPPIIKELEGHGVAGVLSDKLPQGMLQGKGPIMSRLTAAPAASNTPNTLLKRPEQTNTKSGETPTSEAKPKKEEHYSDSEIII